MILSAQLNVLLLWAIGHNRRSINEIKKLEKGNLPQHSYSAKLGNKAIALNLYMIYVLYVFLNTVVLLTVIAMISLRSW